MGDQVRPERIAQLVREEESFLICGHVRPDPDCVGSQLALSHALRKMGRGAEVWLADRVPDNCLFLAGSSSVHQGDAPLREHRVAFVLDTPKPERLGRIAERVLRIPVIVNIDHHPSNTLWGRYNWVDPKASATSEFIQLLIHEMGIEIDREIATCLYAGILTDTGRFCYSNTSPSAHTMAAELLRYGANPEEVSRHIYGSSRIQKIRLLARVLQGLRVDDDGALAWVRITREMYGECGASTEDADGFVNYARDINGVRVAVLLEEMPGREHTRVSMRSQDSRIDVNEIAARYGGGGHHAAAGAVIPGRLEHVEEKLLGEIREAVRRAQHGDRISRGK
ncbi:MAG: bifunctional oligoribonuclease/PAP phosphatase NrnA [Candidatus Aureabacteria bacterium]|nr:bifunctional oligoribonuclease/PAP phosphatase NrnA [Candidatus Auribacterota bacterium]